MGAPAASDTDAGRCAGSCDNQRFPRATTPLVDTAALQQILAQGGWRERFDPGALQRGGDYFRSGRLRALAYRPRGDGGRLEAEVRGRHGALYRTVVTVSSRPDAGDWLCQCECPVTYDCKHAVATLLFAERRPPGAWPALSPAPAAAEPPLPAAPLPAEETDWGAWLQRLETVDDEHAAVVAEPDRVFALLLRGIPAPRQPRLEAAPVWLRPAKSRSSGLVDPQPLVLDIGGPVPAPSGGWPVADAVALGLLLGRSEGRHGSFVPIDTRALEQALADLARRHRVYVEKPAGGAWTLADPVKPALAWKDQADGSQVLDIGIDGTEPAALLRGAGLWYFLPEARRFGPVQASPAWIDLVQGAPRVAPESAEAVRRTLGGRPAAAALPAPVVRTVRHIEAVPVPELTLRPVEVPWRQALRLRTITAGCARLAFDYAGVRVPPAAAATTRLLHEGDLVEIQRDRAHERQVLDLLEQIGLVEADLAAAGGHADDGAQADFLLQPAEQRPPLAPDAWKPVVKQLVEQGVRIVYADGFPRDELIDIDDWHADLAETNTPWFDVALGIDVGGERVDLLPILRRLLTDPRFSLVPRRGERRDAALRVPIDERRSVELPLARVRALVGPLLEWIDADRGERLSVHRSAATSLLAAGDEAGLVWAGAARLRANLDALKGARRVGEPPAGLQAVLREYQREGLAWLGFLADAGLGGVLADDMGLGKTVQVLAHLLDEKARGRLDAPALVVAPTSLIGNWQDEARRFAPSLSVLTLHGADRARAYEAIAGHDLVITTYPLLPRDRERLAATAFALLILDEAQSVKNARSQAAQVVREIPARRRLAMTGTPLENHLGELWALFDAVEPGLLGSERQFARFYRVPIEKHADAERGQRLSRRIAPLLLRRRKEDVLTELPEKTEIVQRLELEGAQRELYETLRLAQHERVREAMRERGLAQSGIVVIDALLKLRQVCCDPRLVKLDSARQAPDSAKLEALLERLDTLIGEGRRILVFSQFAQMLTLIAEALDQRGVDHLMLTGQTPGGARADLVRRFQDGEAPVFLISLKAGGTGLNLTAADAVIHYDPWWNPAVEAQATDRAHRIGQDKPVFVYKLICAGTVEEKIQALQARKAGLADAVLEGTGTGALHLDETDLAELFAPLAPE